MNQLQNFSPPIMPLGVVDEMMKSKQVRTVIIGLSHYWFFNFYFKDYVKYETAKFQLEMFNLTEDQTNRFAVVCAFRGSSKSTIFTSSYPLWAILGAQQKKYVVILSQTQRQAKQYMDNLKLELDHNEMLRADLGPFNVENDEWGSFAIYLSKYNAKISVASSEQSIRGIKHGQYRPDLILADDVEDLNSVKTKEGRDKTYNWFTGEVMPLGDKQTRIIVIGNLLHEDSLLMRLKKQMELNKLRGVYRHYPLLDDNDVIAWPGKYPTMVEIEEQKLLSGSDNAWYREYLLKIVADTNRLVQTTWIQNYDILPNIHTKESQYRYCAIGIDLAISEKETADYTAIVGALVCGWGKDFHIYILPNPTNAQIDFPKTLDRIKVLYGTLVPTQRPKIYIEDVGYQKALIQQLQKENYPVEGFQVHGQDKHARLSLVTQYIQNGVVLFPKSGAETLIQQLTGFGVEKHDDLADAFTILITKITEQFNERPESLNATLLPRRHRPITAGIRDMIF
jgi:predicted phage terminase large subunit-like protein